MILLAVPGSSQGSPPGRVVQPNEIRSATGTWVLSVDPSERHGHGPASYRMEREGFAPMDAALWAFEARWK